MRRNRFTAAVAAAAVLGPAAGWATPERPVRIAVLGDSLALGTGASRADGGFVFPAFRELLRRRPGSRIDNLAIGGATAADVLRLEAPRLSGIRYDIAIVCVGANDVVRQTPGAEFGRRYVELLQNIATRARDARLICCGVPDVGISPLFTDERAAVAAASARGDRRIRAAAAAAHAAFVDLYAVTRAQHDASRFLGRDRFHPSDRGYVLFAGALWPVLARVSDTVH
jgi:lysophospholipase L1-like esterase